MAQMNARLFTGDTETVFLMTDPKYSFISSSLVKEVASFGGSIDGLVPEYVVSRIRSKLQEE
jgi:pantetheine-phosphate adenylyltransferase